MRKNNISQILTTSSVLFYADCISLKEQFIPVTDNCKYYIIYGMPVNCAYLASSSPTFPPDNLYILRSQNELDNMKNTLGFEGVRSFLYDLCSIGAMGVINGELILKCLLYYEDKKVIIKALDTYRTYMKSLQYTQEVRDVDGNVVLQKCSKYVAHANRNKSTSQ